MKTHIKVLIPALFFANLISAQSNYIGSGISLQFNGNDGNYVNLGDVYNDLNFPLTIEAWVYPTAWTAAGDYAGIMATDNASTGSYYGYWFRFNSSGKLIFEIGDGSGAGSTDRRGKVTTGSVALNTWTHIAVVATTVTDIKFYFNGVLQIANNTDGGASNTSIVHNSNEAAIGRHVTPFNEHNFIGKIDELRLWTGSRSQDDIKAGMCEKIITIPGNLTGYWNFDESYVSMSTTDVATPAQDGIVVGDVIKITSGAPIGDESIYKYTNDWSGSKLKLGSATDDYLMVKKIENNPLGMHLYRIDNVPYFTDGLSSYCGFYYGIFPVNGAVTVQYGISYNYTASNGVVTAENQPYSTLFFKNDGSVETWADMTATLDPVQNFIRESGNTTRKELIFNIQEPAFTQDQDQNKRPDHIQTTVVYPNPAKDVINISNVYANDRIFMTDMMGNTVYIRNISETNEVITINIAGLPPGIYMLLLSRQDILISEKLIKL